MWEVFNPVDGKPRYRVRWLFAARLLAWWIKGDYAREGDGWL